MVHYKASTFTILLDAGEDADTDELDRLTRHLRNEIRDLDVEAVNLVKTRAIPEGTKAVDAMTLGVLSVALLPTFVPQLIGFLRSWSERRESRMIRIKTVIEDQSLELEYDPKNMSAADIKSLVEALTGGKPQYDLGEKRIMVDGIETRNQVFISYNRQDKKWLRRLQKALKPYELNNKMSIWDDTRVEPGAEWRKELETGLASAKVAVLLISPNYFGSDFVVEHEFNHFFNAARNEGLKILWIPISSSSYEETPVAEYQALIDPSKPLDRFSPARQNEILTYICKEIAKAVDA